ncbi:hypothetical protein [Streptomyces albospinus]|nr:hypothetical protein [Streptomyces albospinus]
MISTSLAVREWCAVEGVARRERAREAAGVPGARSDVAGRGAP